MQKAFAFENLEVYQRAVEFVEEVDEVIESVRGKFPASRIDQLSRASLSISLNIAEGSGRRAPPERRHFFSIARGSAFECVPLLTVMQRKGRLLPEAHAGLYAKVTTISKMLSGLMKFESTKAEPRSGPPNQGADRPLASPPQT